MSHITDTFRGLLPKIIDFSELISKSRQTFTELLPDNRKRFFETFNGDLNG